MEQYQIEANEQFFQNVIRTLNQGGVWGWPAEMEIFKRQGDKLVANPGALEKVRRIVSEDFFKNYFGNQE